MNITRIILDGIAMTLVFNMTVGMFWFIMPHAYSVMLPKEIQESTTPVTKQEKIRLAAWLYPLHIGMVIWIFVSIINSGTTGFWNIFWSAYIEIMMVNIGDFLILDNYLRLKVKDTDMIPGTKGNKKWESKEWNKDALLEHAVTMPFLFIPLVCAIISFIITKF